MSEVVSTADLWVALDRIAGTLDVLCERLSEPGPEPRVVAEPDPGLVAVLDQMRAQLRDMAQAVPAAPAEVVVPAPDLGPLNEAVRAMQETVKSLPDAIGKHFNIRVGGGGAGSITGPVGLKNTTGTAVDPATTSNVAAVKTAVDNMSTALQATTDQIEGYLDTVEAKLQSLIDATPATNLTARMSARVPATGYALWFDTADTSHIYTLEAPVAATSTSTGFRGVRVTKDASGNPVGKVQTNESATLTFSNRATDPGWS